MNDSCRTSEICGVVTSTSTCDGSTPGTVSCRRSTSTRVYLSSKSSCPPWIPFASATCCANCSPSSSRCCSPEKRVSARLVYTTRRRWQHVYTHCFIYMFLERNLYNDFSVKNSVIVIRIVFVDAYVRFSRRNRNVNNPDIRI